ncbi:hypothetical protein AB1L42_01620 [Thalassoglobus sp. JC818]|uniref:hypothetical protein n=1 Tax=Thalassoglobus sp. JC818 TaxID=3232136 RepID=UPI00345973A0
MMPLASRRICSLLICFVVIIGVFIVDEVAVAAHVHTAFLSGWVLFAMIVVLAAYGLRKSNLFLRVSSRYIGTSSGWLQVHIYLGLCTAFVFGIHTRFRIPDGVVETTLASLYVATFSSGVIGLLMTRWFPKRLANRREEVIFERIAGYRHRLNQEVIDIVREDSTHSQESAFLDLYTDLLQNFFEKPRNLLWHLVDSQRPVALLCNRVGEYRSYLSEEESPRLNRILELIRVKNELDNHYTLQGALKLWLFIHIPLAWGLVVLAVFHALLVLAFT